MKFKSEFLNEINQRGFIYQHIDIDNLDKLISKNKISGYIGFDITSDSLHVGSLIQLMLLHWLDFYGHKSIGLIGGGTTLIGDPSGKDETRKSSQFPGALQVRMFSLCPSSTSKLVGGHSSNKELQISVQS